MTLPIRVVALVGTILVVLGGSYSRADPPRGSTQAQTTAPAAQSSSADSAEQPASGQGDRAATTAPQQQQGATPAGRSEASRFARIRTSEEGTPLALETAIVRYSLADEASSGPTIDLVAAVHVGESSYYKILNRVFSKYDAVLYELVAPPGTVPNGKASDGTNPVSGMQHGLKRLLALEHQIEGVDYKRSNFIHADMSPRQLVASMQERGEGVTDIFVRLLAYSIANQGTKNSTSDAQLLAALFDRNRAVRLKQIMASQLLDLEGVAAAIDGPEGSSLIAERNKVAMNVLDRELRSKKHKKIAIFYGAAHLPDMEQRLATRFALQPIKTWWIEAWNLRLPSERPE